MQEALDCLSLEREAERDECLALQDSLGPHALQQRGLALNKLRLLSVETALFGRTLLTLHLPAGRSLPPTKLSSGAMVALRPSIAPATSAITGTVTALKEAVVCVAFDEMPEEEQLAEPLSLSIMYNDVTYRRLEQALTTLRDERIPATAASLCSALLGEDGPPPNQVINPIALHKLHNISLNEGQREAVAFSLGAKPVALIHGPPGTGKTTAVVELIRQAVDRGEKVLATAASNVAVDNMAERLLAGGGRSLRIVRIGHPARLLPSVVEASLDARMLRSDGGAIVRDVKRDLELAISQVSFQSHS